MSGTPTLGDWIQKITAIRVGLINHNCHSCFEFHDNDTSHQLLRAFFHFSIYNNKLSWLMIPPSLLKSNWFYKWSSILLFMIKNHKDYKDRGPGGVVANIWTNIFQTMKVDHPTFVFLPLIMGRAHCYCIESAKKFQICLLFMLT